MRGTLRGTIVIRHPRRLTSRRLEKGPALLRGLSVFRTGVGEGAFGGHDGPPPPAFASSCSLVPRTNCA